jgi:hypothetical protein
VRVFSIAIRIRSDSEGPVPHALDAADGAEEPTDFVCIEVSYRYPLEGMRTRRQVNGVGAQSCS